MGVLGRFALVLALLLAAYGAVAAVLGARWNRPALVESARTTAFSSLAVIGAAYGALLAAVMANDFSLRYVAENSSRATPTFFKVLSLWSADEGSLLLWNLILAAFVAAVAFRFRRDRPASFPYALATLHVVQVFYLVLVVGPASPFTQLASPPTDGRGPLPLLQNHPLMAAHPPMLYLGFIGFTIPFAFAMGALISGRLSEPWVALTRRWTLAAWVFLSAGLVLGALWSYGVLGWGGYWAWDPVENVALLPWLAATAFLHSSVLEERRGMFRTWNLSLVVGAFALTTFGTFLTRGSVLLSVHAFAASLVGPLYLGFLVLVMLVGFGLIAARAVQLRAPARLERAVSRGSAFVAQNVLLVAITLIVLLGTIFPLAMEAITGSRVSVGGPYFDQTTVPLFLLLLFLMGVGPLLSWRRAAPGEAARRLTVPAGATAAVTVLLAVAGVHGFGALLAFGLATFVLTANGAGLIRRIGATRRTRSLGTFRAVGSTWSEDPRRFGGLVVHLGIAIAAIAITASACFTQQTEVTLARGEATSFAGYRLRYQERRVLQQPQREVLVADVAVTRGGAPAGTVDPSLNVYPSSTDPIGTPSIRYGVRADLYASVLGFSADGSTATLRFYHTPGVSWLWMGGAIVILGGVLALRPRPRRSPPAVVAPVDRPVAEGVPA
ncbi:MAG TPA: cytochrome c-type biogenesis CcmF C-terminal domain-containing protein [Actinomycetota bacterium]|jgi:cytochrome c-type biogenesis protein CcmF|nr:cytochrome c-type biogenesis CcmF C-terminal domain-containing protein [Actinomycetota bacterium]